MKKTGILILFFGLALTIFTTATYFTREKVVDIGNLKISAKKRHHISWSPLVGIAVMGVGGAFVFIASGKKQDT